MNNLRLGAIALFSSGLILLVLLTIFAPMYSWATGLMLLSVVAILGVLILSVFLNLRMHIDLVERTNCPKCA